MSATKGRIAVAMSGGVDSSVAAALLVEQGYDVFGIMLRLWAESGEISGRRDNRCCTRDQMIYAHLIARKLGIPFDVIDARDVFKRQVVDGFIQGYADGITPNPCLSCNRHIRFTYLLDEAVSRGATHLATGHYARINVGPSGEFELRQGADSGKDQSYVLSVLTQVQLAHAMFPVGGYTKPQVRELATRFGLPVATKIESQDLCFVADGDYRRFMKTLAPGAMTPGPIRLSSGQVIGQHSGLTDYTIGQRKGLGIAWSEPLYVITKEIESNTLVVGPRSELGSEYLRAERINWIAGTPPSGEIAADVKTRYKAAKLAARILPMEAASADVWLTQPVGDITPGQGAVFYDGDRVLGGGIITRNTPR